MENKASEDLQSQIVVIGAQIPALRSYASFSDRLSLAQQGMVTGKWTNPQTIASHNGLVALIDYKSDLWILDNSFAGPLNITEVLRMKAKRLFLGEGQLIFENRRHGWILINWNGKIDLNQGKLRKANIHHSPWNNSIDAYFLEEQCQDGSMWYYSTIKKVQNTLKIYHVNAETNEIIGYPAGKVIKIPEKIAGMSLGKYHGLCWTVSGRIFAWGCKNLAMGLRQYDKGYYDQAQQVSLPQPIFKALAGTNYSIALSASGNLYEWGVSKLGEPIITPRILSIKNKKFLDLKGYQNAYVGLTSGNELLCWGKGAQRYCKGYDNSENVTVILKDKNVKIYNYHVEENCIISLIGKDTGKINKDQRHYFAQVVRKVSQKWLPHRLKKDATSTSYSKFRNDVKGNESSIEVVRKNEDYIDRLICNQMNKQDYFNVVQNQESVFRKLMEEKTARSSTKVESVSFIKDSTSNTINKLSRSKILKCHRKVESARQTPNLTLDIQTSTRVIRQYEAEQATIRNSRKKCKMPVANKKQHQNYQARLEAVLQKKCMMEEKKKIEIMEALQKRLEAQRKQRQQAREIELSEQKAILGRLKKLFCKNYLCQLLKAPINYGRQIKINQMILNSNPKPGSSSMKNSLLQSRAIIFIKSLKTVHPDKYEIVAKVIVRAVERWRMKKDKTYRAQIVKQMVKSAIRRKIETNLSHAWLAARKIQKVARWITAQQKQRTLQLKMLWKKSLLLYLKPTPSFQNKKPSICKEDLNYKLCNDRSRNPRLMAYLGNSPIFKLRLPKDATMACLQRNYAQSLVTPMNFFLVKDPNNKKGVSWAEYEVSQLRADGACRDQRRSFTNFGAGPIDILLYSQHYDCFYKPKNYQINIADCMKQSEKWIAEQRKILNRIIKDILFRQWRNFYDQKIAYEQKLAYFIKENYDSLTEFRWKYLIQFNKIKDDNSLSTIKKEKELYKLMKSINAQHLLASDVIPQKHRIIQYAKHLKGSPAPPSLDIVLTQQQFKQQFKIYYQNTSNKAKYLRKFFN